MKTIYEKYHGFVTPPFIPPQWGNRLNKGIQEEKANAFLWFQQNLQSMIPDSFYMGRLC